MFLICNESGANGCIWGNVFLNLLAIGAFCAIVLLIWKGLCWLDSCQWGKKHQRETDSDSRYSVLKNFTETIATLQQRKTSLKEKTVYRNKSQLEIKGELVLIKQLIAMCFDAKIIQMGGIDQAIDKISVYLIDVYVQSMDYMLINNHKTFKYEEIMKVCEDLKVEYNKISNDIKNPPKDKSIKEIVNNWLSINETIEIKNKLNGVVADIDKCIDDSLKNNDNGQTQQ